MSDKSKTEVPGLPDQGQVVVYNRTDKPVNTITRGLRVHIEPRGTAIVPARKVPPLIAKFPYLSIDPLPGLRRAQYSEQEIAQAKALPKAEKDKILHGLMLGQSPPVLKAEPDEADKEKGK